MEEAQRSGTAEDGGIGGGTEAASEGTEAWLTWTGA